MKTFISIVIMVLVSGPTMAQSPASSIPAAPIIKTDPPVCESTAPKEDQNGELIYSGCQIKAMGGSIPKLISSPKEPDLSRLYRLGIQGQIVFDLIIGKDGRTRNVSVKTSSRSSDLDAIALGLVKSSSFAPATDREGKPISARAAFPMFFWKDSLGNTEFLKKKCGQFLIDASWHAEHFPEEKPEKYRGWLLANGMLFMGSIRAGGLSAIGTAREIPKTPSYSEVVEVCISKPDKLFLDVLAGK